MLTRAMDIIFSLIGILGFLPFLPIIALLIKFSSKGPVFYTCDRVGKGGQVFKMYKFRTMYCTPDNIGPSLSALGDPRVNPVGRVLRRLKLNEMPQLFNVLKGDMTLVGPRPESPDLAAAYPEEAKAIFAVKPGLAGPNQILGRNEEELFPPGEDPVKYYFEYILPSKIAVDLQYLKEKSFLKDIKFLFLAVKVVITQGVGRRHFNDNRNQLLLLGCDIVLSLGSFFLAHFLRYEDLTLAKSYPFYRILPWVLLIRLPIFIYFGFYETLIRHFALFDIKIIFYAVALSSLLLTSFSYLTGLTFDPILHSGYSRAVFFIDWFCLTTMLIGYRILLKKIYLRYHNNNITNSNKKNILIWGAGDAGELCLTYLQKDRNQVREVIGFIDDDSQKKGKRIKGVRILGDRHHLDLLSKLYQIQEVFVAVPSASMDNLKEILTLCRDRGLSTELFLIKPDDFAELNILPHSPVSGYAPG
jgi:lipopolysaccharide/colanic/teichoic acid biosynthesis glycosyltransferase